MYILLSIHQQLFCKPHSPFKTAENATSHNVARTFTSDTTVWAVLKPWHLTSQEMLVNITANGKCGLKVDLVRSY
jgi:hypothetical protein